MEIPRLLRNKRALDALQNGLGFSGQRSLQKAMVEAGRRERTAEQVLESHYEYIDGKQNQLLKQAIEKRSLIEIFVLATLDA